MVCHKGMGIHADDFSLHDCWQQTGQDAKLLCMATATFDTVQVARDIEAAGLKREQAEAIVQAIHRRSEDAVTEAFATLKAEIWKAAFTATGIVIAANAVAVGVLLTSLA